MFELEIQLINCLSFFYTKKSQKDYKTTIIKQQKSFNNEYEKITLLLTQSIFIIHLEFFLMIPHRPSKDGS